MITFAGGTIDLDTFNHENMHQWWGDNVTEANYNLTFFKEGMATLGEYLFGARDGRDRRPAVHRPRPGGPRSTRAWSTVRRATTHGPTCGPAAPSDPTPYTLFSGSSTYTRPGIAYLALRQILGQRRTSTDALQYLQRTYGGATITEAGARGRRSATGCRSRARPARLSSATSSRSGSTPRTPPPTGATKPTITGPGLDGPGFYGRGNTCS